MEEDELLVDVFMSMRRKLLLGAEELVILINGKVFVLFINAEHIDLLVDA